MLKLNSRRSAGCAGRPPPAPRSGSRRRCGKPGRGRTAAPCTTATPSVFQQLGDEVLVGGDRLAASAPSCRSCRRRTDRRRTRLPASGIRCPRAWLSIETTRSRRSLNTSLCFGMKSCGPLSASTAAHCDDRGRVRGRLRLDHRHRLDQRLRPAGIADAPAGHAIGLGHAVHGQRALVEPRLDLRRRGELEVVIDQVLVHVVGQHPDMRMPHQHVGQRLQLGARVGGAGRVRRRVEDQPLGLRRDRALERARACSLKPFCIARLDRTGSPPASSTMSG